MIQSKIPDKNIWIWTLKQTPQISERIPFLFKWGNQAGFDSPSRCSVSRPSLRSRSWILLGLDSRGMKAIFCQTNLSLITWAHRCFFRTRSRPEAWPGLQQRPSGGGPGVKFWSAFFRECFFRVYGNEQVEILFLSDKLLSSLLGFYTVYAPFTIKTGKKSTFKKRNNGVFPFHDEVHFLFVNNWGHQL